MKNQKSRRMLSVALACAMVFAQTDVGQLITRAEGSQAEITQDEAAQAVEESGAAVEAAAQAAAESEAAAKAAAESEAAAKAAAESEAAAKAAAESEAAAKAAAESEAAAKAESGAAAEKETEQKEPETLAGQPGTQQTESEKETEQAGPAAESEPSGESETQPSDESESEPGTESESETEAGAEGESESETEKESESETEKAELTSSVRQEVFTETDGTLSVKYTIEIVNETVLADAEDVTVKAVFGGASSYYVGGCQTRGGVYVEDITQVPAGLDLHELAAYSQEQLAGFCSAVVWQDQVIAGGEQKEYVFLVHAGEGATGTESFPAMYFVDGEQVGSEKVQWINAEMLEQTETETESETEELPTTFQYEDSEKIVTAVIADGNVLPTGAVLAVRTLEEGTAEYEEAAAQVESAAESQDKVAAEYTLYDIYFEADGEKVEPADSFVSVAIQYKKSLSVDAEDVTEQDVQVIHLAEEQDAVSAEEVTDNVSLTSAGNVKSVEFSTDSFSTFAVVIVQDAVEIQVTLQFYNHDGTSTIGGTYDEPLYVYLQEINNSTKRAYAELDIKDGYASATIAELYDQNGNSLGKPANGNYEVLLFTTESEVKQNQGYQSFQKKKEYGNGDIILYAYTLQTETSYSITASDKCIELKANRIGTTSYSASDILDELGIAKNFGAFTKYFHQTGDIEATVAAAVATMEGDYNYSDNNFIKGSTNTITVSKSFTEDGKAKQGENVTFVLYKEEMGSGGETKVNELSATTDGDGTASVTFERLTAGTYNVYEKIGETVITNNLGTNDGITVTYTGNIDLVMQPGYDNYSYFGTIQDNVGHPRNGSTIIIEDELSYNTYKDETGRIASVILQSKSDVEKIDFNTVFSSIESLASTLYSAYGTEGLTVYNLKASDLKRDMNLKTNEGYLLVNVDMTEADNSFSFGQYTIDGQQPDSWDPTGNRIFWNFGNYSGTINQNGICAGTVIAPKASYYVNVTFVGSIIADKILGTNNEIHFLWGTELQQNYKVSVSNTKNSSKATANVSAKKTLTGRTLKDNEFSFSLTKVSAVGEDGQTTITDPNTDQTDKTNTAAGEVKFDPLEYTQAGTYTYKLKETSTGGKGVTVDQKEYTVTVTVTDSGEGTLSAATVYSLDNETVNAAEFTNTYRAKSVKESVSGTKTLTGKDLTKDQFEFEMKLVSVDNDTSKGGTTYTAKNGAPDATTEAGAIVFPEIEYTAAGVYVYEVRETSTGGKGISVDMSTYTVTITVTDDGEGQLHAAKTITKDKETTDAITFENRYETGKATANVSAKKTLTGRTLKDNEFSFSLIKVSAVGADGKTTITDPNTDQTDKTNTAAGEVKFDPLEYTQAGTYTYKLKETSTGGKGVTVDQKEYTVTVTVTDSGEGTLSATTAYSLDSKTVDAAEFTNTYTASGDIELSGTKLYNRDLVGNDFEFTLTEVDADGNVVEDGHTDTAKNDAEGNFKFGKISYSKAGTYYYQVAEKNGGQTINGTTYDKTVYTVTVKVEDDEKGKLTATADMTPTQLTFTNTYTASGELTLEALKSMANAQDALAAFTFELKDADGNVLETVTNDAAGRIAFTGLAYGLEDAGKTFTYTVNEQQPQGADMYIYDATVYTVAVTVIDNGDGTLETNAVVTGSSGNVPYTADAMKFVNDVTSVKVNKVDAVDGKVLTGAHLQILDEAGQLVAEWDSAAEAHELKGLTVGKTYTLHETVAPAGYSVNTVDVTFTLDAKGQIDTAKTTAKVSADGIVLVEDYVKSKKALISVTKQITLNGAPMAATGQTFYVALYADEACTNRISDIEPVVFRNASSSTVEFKGLDLGRTYYVGECGADGAALLSGALADGSVYTVNFASGNQATVTEADGTATVTFANDFLNVPQGFYKQGWLTVTKRLLGSDGGDLESDEVFYAGIFDDASYTKLSEQVSQNIVPLELKGNSSVSAEVEVVVPADGTSTTVYVTEVDEDGTPVSDARDFAYEVSVDRTKVTMDENHSEDTVTITNKEYEEVETEVETETEKSGKAVKTGDDTPVLPYAMAQVAAAMVVLLLWYRRRKMAGK